MRGVLGFALIALFARAAADPPQLPQNAENALTMIDSVPTQAQLNTAFQTTNAEPLLLPLVTNPGTDVGVRLRAIHALAQYCSPCTTTDPAYSTLAAIVTASTIGQTGSDLLVLRAAIASLGPMRATPPPYERLLLEPMLDHPSRDIRAAAAFALRDLCDSTASSALRTRYQVETVDQVRLAISAALRTLSQPECE